MRRNKAVTISDPKLAREVSDLVRQSKALARKAAKADVKARRRAIAGREGGARPPAPRRDDEHRLQVECFAWLDAAKGQYHALELMYAIPNGGDRHPAVAAKLKAEGVKSGVLDTHLPVARHRYCSLWVELKTMSGSLQREQKGWLDALVAEDNSCWVVRSLAQFQAVVLWYIHAGPHPSEMSWGPMKGDRPLEWTDRSAPPTAD